MKISIITPTFNSQKNVADALISVQKQTFKQISHIIIDGYSTDETLNIVKQIGYPSIRIISEPDSGIYDAINKGIKMSEGIIGLLHSDDIFNSQDSIEKVVNLFEKTKIDCMYGDLKYVSSSNINKVIRHWKAGRFRKEKLKWGWMPPHPTFFAKKEVFDKHGLYDLSYRISSDYDFMLRVFLDKEIKIGYLSDTITKMRLGGTSNKSFKNIVNKSIEDYKIIKKNKLNGSLTLIMKNLRKLSQFIK